MNDIYSQKEILLLLNTRFVSKNWVKRNETASDKQFSVKEKLIDACWNGLLPEILPECFGEANDNQITLWEVNDANTFLDLEYCQQPQIREKEFSLNPYIFLDVQEQN